MSMAFQKATKRSARLRMALIGVAGAGKTYTALNIAQHLGGAVAVIDTERGSASKYSDMFDFDVLELEVFSPQMYVEAIQAAEEAGYEVLVIDSLSHAWTGKGGALDQVDRSAKRSQSGNTFGAWRNVTPLHNAMVDAIINTKMHVITTMRAKTDYVQEKDEKTGKVTVRKVGLAPVQRDGLEYEFDVVADLDMDNNLIVGKTRCSAVAGAVIPKAGKEIATKLKAWLSDGSEARFEAPQTKAKAEPKTDTKREARVSESRVGESAPEAKPDAKIEAAVAESDAWYDDEDAPHCHCGVEAKYVRGKSGRGWVCGHQGSGEPSCDFRLKDTAPEPLAEGDPFAEAEPSGAALNGTAAA